MLVRVEPVSRKFVGAGGGLVIVPVDSSVVVPSIPAHPVVPLANIAINTPAEINSPVGFMPSSS
jgi:hypothetical protein